MKIVSLFSGAGGLEIAVCQTGLAGHIISNDSNVIFLTTVKSNMERHFPGVTHDAILKDTRELSGHDFCMLPNSKLDLVIGGPPCDDYTITGKRRGIDGKKGSLIFEYARLVSDLAPDCFVFENVPNLAHQFKSTFDMFLNTIKSFGYYFKWSILSASSYGSPTMRKRIFVVGFKSMELSNRYNFPVATHNNCRDQLSLDSSTQDFIYVSDVLKDLPDTILGGCPDVFNHTGRKHRLKTIEMMKSVPQGQQIRKSFRYRVPWDGLCRSLTAGLDDSTKSYIHPVYDREMSVREYARIHGFPDSWFFHGTHHHGIKQVANAVPIPLGKAVINSVMNTLRAINEDE